MEYEIVIRDNDNKEIVRQIVPEPLFIYITKLEMIEDGWKKATPLWNNLSEKEKK